MGVRKTPQQWMDKWGRNLGQAGIDIKEGINAVTVAPGEKAAAAQERMLANLIESVQSGAWARAVAGVSLPEWKAAMIEKGMPRIAQGIASAKANKMGSIANLLEDVKTAVAAANAIPKGDIQASIARASAYMTSMQESAKTRKQSK